MANIICRKYEIVIHSPYNLKINLKNAVIKNYGTQLIVTEFKSKFMPLFWNFIWYCKIHELDYSIILPYLNDIKDLKKIKYKNNAKDIFEIKYEDKYYNENLKKIEKYSKDIYDRFIAKSKQKKLYHVDLEEINEINLEIIKGKENMDNLKQFKINDYLNGNNNEDDIDMNINIDSEKKKEDENKINIIEQNKDYDNEQQEDIKGSRNYGLNEEIKGSRNFELNDDECQNEENKEARRY